MIPPIVSSIGDRHRVTPGGGGRTRDARKVLHHRAELLISAALGPAVVAVVVRGVRGGGGEVAYELHVSPLAHFPKGEGRGVLSGERLNSRWFGCLGLFRFSLCETKAANP